MHGHYQNNFVKSVFIYTIIYYIYYMKVGFIAQLYEVQGEQL